MFVEIAVIFILGLVMKLSKYPSAIYYFKHFVYYGGVMLAALLWIPYFATRPKSVLNLLTASTILSPISKLIRLKWELRGAENLNKPEACVIVANHQSSLDILGMFEIWHEMGKVTVIAKRGLLYAGTFGLAAWLCGLVFIDKKAREESKDLINEAFAELKKQNVKLWMFPEGTRHNTGVIHDFKKGAFYVAIQSQVPIIPVVFSSYRIFLDDDLKILNPGETIIEALPPISTQGLTLNDIDSLMTKTRNLMCEKFAQNSKEIQANIDKF